MNEIAIQVEKLSKLYHLGGGTRSKLLKEALRGSAARAYGRLAGKKTLDPEESPVFWALREVSFEIRRGDVVGILGHNGAGKSVLLKILSRITKPTSGRARIVGRVGSLLEIGTGFHPELSGRDNIFLNGAILGMSRDEIRKKFDEIVAFSGVGQFIDTPVKHYSSGMSLRLAFSVSAFLDADVILLDEVWAAGDVDFQARSLAKMHELIGAGRTVVLVSHALEQIKQLCRRAILIDHGRLIADGDPGSVIEHYLGLDSRIDAAERPAPESQPLGPPRRRKVWSGSTPPPGDNVLRLREVATQDGSGVDCYSFRRGEPINLRIRADVLDAIQPILLGFALVHESGKVELVLSNVADRAAAIGRGDARVPAPGTYETGFSIPTARLPGGAYRISIIGGTPSNFFTHAHLVASDVIELMLAERPSDRPENPSPGVFEHVPMVWRVVEGLGESECSGAEAQTCARP